MKPMMVIVVCLSILYAGAVSAFAGCENLFAGKVGHEHGDSSGGHPHDHGAAPQHSDSEKIHCPNLFGAFVVGHRVSLKPERLVTPFVGFQTLHLTSVMQQLAASGFDRGPPVSLVSSLRPLHLRLSVIRI